MSAPKPPSTPKPELKAVKTKICIRKTDVSQCRLCLRIVKRAEIRQTRSRETIDLGRKIEDAVAVRITSFDKLTTVCVNCLRLVDIIYNFRKACLKTNAIHSTKLLMLHEGKWCSEETKQNLEDCQQLVRRHRNEMDKLYKCAGLVPGSLENYAGEVESPLKPTEDAPVPEPLPEEFSDSEPEMTEQYAKKVDDLGPPVERSKPVRSTYICEVCGKTINKANEEFHRNQHQDVKPYSCTEFDGCKLAFHSAKALARHVKNFHIDGPGSFECDVCHKHIRGIGPFRIHRRRHDDVTVNSAACQICGKRYRLQYIKDHMNTHTGHLMYECEKCGKKFAAKNNMKTHIKKCTFKPEKKEPVHEEWVEPVGIDW